MNRTRDTKGNILKVALHRASRHGLESLSFGELAKEVNMSKSGLFAHFKSKENLQIMVFDLASEVFREKVMVPSVAAPRGVPRILALSRNWLYWEDDEFPGGCPIITATVEFDDRPGKLRDHVFKLQVQWMKGLSFAAQLAVQEGHFHAAADPDQFAFELYSYMLGYQLHKRMMNDPNAFERQKKAFQELLWRNCSDEYRTTSDLFSQSK